MIVKAPSPSISSRWRMPLSSARTVLARSIESLEKSRQQLEERHQQLAELEDASRRHISPETVELRRAILSLLGAQQSHQIDTGMAGVKSMPACALIAGSSGAGAQISDAEQAYNSAAEEVGSASAQRDGAVWSVVREVAESILSELRDGIGFVVQTEGRLRGIIEALREAGRCGENNDKQALHTAWCIEQAMAESRMRPPPAVESGNGRALIERLRMDPTAAL